MAKNKVKNGIGGFNYINPHCWLTRVLGYAPVERCRYCEIKFRACLFFQHLVVSVLLVFFLFGLSWLTTGEVSRLVVVSVFILIIVYGYFFSRSTEKIIRTSFAEKQAKEALRQLNEELESRVNQRTEELKRAYDELRVLDRAKTEFMSIASHQLRTPLGAMRGYLSMLISGDFGALAPKAKEAAEEVYQASLRLLKLSNDLLNVSQIESGQVSLSYQEVSVKRFLPGIVKEFKALARKKGLGFKTEIDGDLKKVEIDPDKIRQAVLNILDNAFKYTEKGRITIRAKIKNPNRFLISVEDTGSGLDQKDINDLFRSFFRGWAGKKFHPAGSGLGLYIAHKFVSQHKGRLWAESPGRGKGASFFIEMPIRNNPMS